MFKVELVVVLASAVLVDVVVVAGVVVVVVVVFAAFDVVVVVDELFPPPPQAATRAAAPITAHSHRARLIIWHPFLIAPRTAVGSPVCDGCSTAAAAPRRGTSTSVPRLVPGFVQRLASSLPFRTLATSTGCGSG